MFKTVRYFVIGLAVMLLFAGCAKQPSQEINAAKTAVDAAMADGAEKYAATDAKQLGDSLNAAMAEVKTQDGKFMKNYDKAKAMLAKIKTDADTLKAGLGAKKEEAKKNALDAQAKAKSAIGEAKALLAKAPKGKGSRADIEAMKADLKGLEEAMPDIQKLIDTEDYAAAADKATNVADKAGAVAEEVKKAMQKTGAKTEKKAAAKKAHGKK